MKQNNLKTVCTFLDTKKQNILLVTVTVVSNLCIFDNAGIFNVSG